MKTKHIRVHIHAVDHAVVRFLLQQRSADIVGHICGQKMDNEILRICRSCGAPKRCKRCGTPQPYDGRYCETCGVFLLDFVECLDVDAVLSIGVICMLLLLPVLLR